MTSASRFDAIAYQLPEIDVSFICACFLVTRSPRFEDLLDGLGQAVGITQHNAIKLLFPRLGQFPALQCFQMKPYGGYGSFQFMSHSIDEAIVLLASSQLSNQEDRI